MSGKAPFLPLRLIDATASRWRCCACVNTAEENRRKKLMNSLVGYGVSSESSSEDEEETRSGAEKNEENEFSLKKSRNFLLESGSASSESGSESGSDKEREEERAPVSVLSSPKQPAPPSAGSAGNKLPPPALGDSCAPAGGSVFANPFKEQAEEKLNALQKHVPLTLHARPSHIGGRKVCTAYRKNGRCRFGIRCKFAHDSDLHQSAAEHTAADSSDAPARAPACGQSAVQRDREDEEEIRSRRKKQRVGVSDSLIPPKRALKQYMAHRDDVSHTHKRVKTGCEK